jgi:hypothetical protein
MKAARTIAMLFALGTLVAACGVAKASYIAAVLADNPIGYWRLGESAGATQAQDETSYNRPLDYNGFSNPDYGQPGAIVADLDTAMRFTTARPTIASPNTTDFGFASGQSFSLEYWIRVAPGNASSTDAGVVDKGYDSAQARPWYLSRYNRASNGGNGMVDFYLRNTAGTSRYVLSTSSVPLNDDEWHHVVGVYDSADAQVRLYVDAVYQGAATGVPQAAYGTNSRRFIVGNHLNRAFDGQVDELALYAVALDNLDGIGGVDSDNRVFAHYQAAFAPAIIPEPSTFLVWSLLAALGIGTAAYRRKR